MNEEDILAEIEIDLTESYRSESVPPNEPQYPDDLEQVKRGECTVKDLRGKGGTQKLEKWKVWQYMQIALLCTVIVIVWGLLAIPIVMYHLPPKELEAGSTAETSNCTMIAQTSDSCLPTITYEGQFCREHLQEFQNCLPGRAGSSDIYIAPQDDQDVLEMQFVSLLTDSTQLQFLVATPECENIIRPLFCVSAFRLCDGDGGLYDLSCGTCVTIRDGVCATFWIRVTELIQSLPPDIAAGFPSLPVCESLPDPTGTCTVEASGQSASSNSSETLGGNGLDNSTNSEDSSPQIVRNCSTIQCSEGFYCTVDATSNFSICRPRCDTWEQYPRSTLVALDVITILTAIIGLIAGTAGLIIASIRWRAVFTFPSVFAVYLTISVMGYALINLMVYIDRTKLFCSSLDLQESVGNPTPFCTFTGIALHYLVLQTQLWWFIHITALFWGIKFPMHARSFEMRKKSKYLHFAGVVVGLVLPVVPVIVIATTGGFTVTRFPPQICVGKNQDSVFYSNTLLIIILAQIGTALLVIIFWVIHKHHGLFREKRSKSQFKIGTAEKKVLLSFSYYVVASGFSNVAFTLLTRDASNFNRELTEYFVCEAQGFNPDMPCDRNSYLEFTHPELLSISCFLYELFPVATLLFLVSFKELKQFCGYANAPSSSTTTTSHTDT